MLKTQKFFSSGCGRESNQAWWPFTITKLMAPHFSWHTQSHYVPLANSKLFHILGVNIFLVWYLVQSMINTNLLKTCFFMIYTDQYVGTSLVYQYAPSWFCLVIPDMRRSHFLTVTPLLFCRGDSPTKSAQRLKRAKYDPENVCIIALGLRFIN